MPPLGNRGPLGQAPDDLLIVLLVTDPLLEMLVLSPEVLAALVPPDALDSHCLLVFNIFGCKLNLVVGGGLLLGRGLLGEDVGAQGHSLAERAH
jgi:hypothetical protein